MTALVLTAVVASPVRYWSTTCCAAELADELTEVPLMGAMFLAMVWHAQRRRSAMEDLRRVSDANLRLLQRERQFVQDASHELRTPITVALGHAELVERASGDPELAEDARIVVDELLRLRRLADRLLLLATSEDPDFLSRSPVDIGYLLAAALQRWAPIDRRWRLEPAEPATVVGDPDRLGLALDALIENAVKHTGSGDEIRLGSRRQGDQVAIVVVDSGTGMPADQLATIFERFARLDGPAAATWAAPASASRSSRPSCKPTAARCGAERARHREHLRARAAARAPPRPDRRAPGFAGRRLQGTWLHG